MVKNIFVNLPVKDLKKTKQFFTKLGFKFDPQFTDQKAACLILGKNMYSMLITEAFFKRFTKKKIVNAKTNTEVLIAFSVSTRKEVDALMKKVIAAGGKEFRKPEDYGWMYARSFQDLDGHIWEPFFSDIKKRPKQ